MKVRYLEENNTAQLDPAIDSAFRVGSRLQGKEGFYGPIGYDEAVQATLSLLAPSYKHVAFAHECEWRMVVDKPHKPMPGQRFRVGKSTLIPYVEVELNRDLQHKVSDEYMLSRVILAPTPNVDLALEAVRNLFISKGQDVIVEASTIPYRDW
jgi:hypothetical protein